MSFLIRYSVFVLLIALVFWLAADSRAEWNTRLMIIMMIVAGSVFIL